RRPEVKRHLQTFLYVFYGEDEAGSVVIAGSVDNDAGVRLHWRGSDPSLAGVAGSAIGAPGADALLRFSRRPFGCAVYAVRAKSGFGERGIDRKRERGRGEYGQAEGQPRGWFGDMIFGDELNPGADPFRRYGQGSGLPLAGGLRG